MLTASDELAFARIRRRHAPLKPVQGLQGLQAHQSETLETVWSAVSQRLPGAGIPPPYWAVAWPGGRALANHIRTETQGLQGRRVLELGCGGAVAAIAAAQSGAVEVTAVDIDPLACLAARANAQANAVRLEVLQADLLEGPVEERWDVILAADLWYERFFAHRVSAWLRDRAAAGARVLLADLGRAFLPHQGLREIGRIELKDRLGTEQGTNLSVRICQIEAAPRPDSRVSAESAVAHQACV